MKRISNLRKKHIGEKKQIKSTKRKNTTIISNNNFLKNTRLNIYKYTNINQIR